MQPNTELSRSHTGLIYRVRRGQARDGLIVMLHGLSGDENVMWIFDHALPRSATVIAPRAPYAAEIGGYSWDRMARHDNLDDADFQDAIEHLSRLLSEVIPLYQADPQRVIIMGFSQGAAVSYTLSVVQPDRLRGVIALAGFLPQPARGTLALQTGHERGGFGALSQDASPRYLILHGTYDEAVPIDQARAARSVLERYGAAVEYHEHRVGHKVSAQGMKEIARWVAETLREF